MSNTYQINHEVAMDYCTEIMKKKLYPVQYARKFSLFLYNWKWPNSGFKIYISKIAEKLPDTFPTSLLK